MTGALLIWVPVAVVILFAMRFLAGRVLDAEAAWGQVRGVSTRTAGEDGAGHAIPLDAPSPSPAVSALDGCDCPGCECARLLERDGGQP